MKAVIKTSLGKLDNITTLHKNYSVPDNIKVEGVKSVLTEDYYLYLNPVSKAIANQMLSNSQSSYINMVVEQNKIINDKTNDVIRGLILDENVNQKVQDLMTVATSSRNNANNFFHMTSPENYQDFVDFYVKPKIDRDIQSGKLMDGLSKEFGKEGEQMLSHFYRFEKSNDKDSFTKLIGDKESISKYNRILNSLPDYDINEERILTQEAKNFISKDSVQNITNQIEEKLQDLSIENVLKLDPKDYQSIANESIRDDFIQQSVHNVLTREDNRCDLAMARIHPDIYQKEVLLEYVDLVKENLQKQGVIKMPIEINSQTLHDERLALQSNYFKDQPQVFHESNSELEIDISKDHTIKLYANQIREGQAIEVKQGEMWINADRFAEYFNKGMDKVECRSIGSQGYNKLYELAHETARRDSIMLNIENNIADKLWNNFEQNRNAYSINMRNKNVEDIDEKTFKDAMITTLDNNKDKTLEMQNVIAHNFDKNDSSRYLEHESIQQCLKSIDENKERNLGNVVKQQIDKVNIVQKLVRKFERKQEYERDYEDRER